MPGGYDDADAMRWFDCAHYDMVFLWGSSALHSSRHSMQPLHWYCQPARASNWIWC